VQFPNSKTPDFGGRVGIVVRRAAASQVTEGYKVVRNRVRKAHYGVWLFGVNEGSVTSNDLRGCASAEPDSVRFQDHGAAVRVDLNGLCNTNFSSNDFTGLKSPKASAAVVMLPSVLPCQGGGNRVDPGRPVFGEPNP
jgi:hypothetical protein